MDQKIRHYLETAEDYFEDARGAMQDNDTRAARLDLDFARTAAEIAKTLAVVDLHDEDAPQVSGVQGGVAERRRKEKPQYSRSGDAGQTARQRSQHADETPAKMVVGDMTVILYDVVANVEVYREMLPKYLLDSPHRQSAQRGAVQKVEEWADENGYVIATRVPMKSRLERSD